MLVERKFQEAKYFLNQVERLEHSPEEMMYNLDAFLTSSKSITDYYGKVLGKDSDKWYKSITSQFPLIADFKDKRNFIVHEGFLSLNAKTEITHTERISVSISVAFNVYRVDENGEPIIDDNHNKISTSTERDPYRSDMKNAGAIANSFYFFEDYPDKTVLELCKQYYNELNEACLQSKTLSVPRTTPAVSANSIEEQDKGKDALSHE